jgi:GAF domain-containing protein
VDLIATLQRCFAADRVLYSRHARDEMRYEEFGAISDVEVGEAIANATLVEEYPDDTPYPSALLLGRTSTERPLHIVCAYAEVEDRTVVVTVYQPDPERWDDELRRRKS